MDEKDKKIINQISKDSKSSLRKLSQKLKVSFVTVMNRIKKLEKSKIIRGYYSKIDYSKLGYDVHVIIEMRISKGKMKEMEEKIAKKPQVYAVYDTTGNFDAMVLARFKSTTSMNTFLKQIQTYNFVERTNTKVVLETIKEDQIEI